MTPVFQWTIWAMRPLCWWTIWAIKPVDYQSNEAFVQTCLSLKMKNSALTAKNSKINKKRVNLETFVFAVNEHIHYSNSPTHFFNQLFSISVQAHNKKQTAKQRSRKKKKTFHIKSAACAIIGEALCGKSWKASNEAQTGCTVLMQTIYFFSVL